jgi:iron complex outermembrane receptor protein
MSRVFECWIATAVVCAAGSARADEVIRVEGTSPPEGARDRTRLLGAAPFLTILHPDERAPVATVADALATTAGAQTRSLGGLGAFESVSVRGASPGHTAVLVDGVPLARIASVTADLGRFSMDAFGEVELYRGAVPIELGGAGVGGAVNLVTRLGRGERGERVRASVGAGSYGARHARFHHGDAFGSLHTSATLAYQGATGDYSYFSDNGTPLNKTDDTTLVRGNNGFDQVDLVARAGTVGRSRGTGGERAGGVRAIWKRQGLPGSVAQPADGASLSTIDVLADARAMHRAGPAVARELAYVLVETQALRDPMAELGLGTQDRSYLTLSGGASSAWTFAVADGVRLDTGLELRGDRFRDADRDGARREVVGTRGGAAASAAIVLLLGRSIEVTPAMRVDVVRTAPTPALPGTAGEPDEIAPRRDLVASPRLTARALLGGDVAVKASAGRYVRLPTLVELFGSRGVILGSPELLPERGPTVDAGLVYAPVASLGRGHLDRVLVQVAAFGTRARDTIALVSTAGFAARALNIGATQTYGVELVAGARLARTVSLTASYTRLVTEQHTIDPSYAGKAIPRTPGHLAYARLEAARRVAVFGKRELGAWIDAAAQATAYLDQANFQRVPARVLVGTGARIELARGLGVALSVANLANVRVVELPADRPGDVAVTTALSDLAGFPLPGRSFYLSVDYRH